MLNKLSHPRLLPASMLCLFLMGLLVLRTDPTQTVVTHSWVLHQALVMCQHNNGANAIHLNTATYSVGKGQVEIIGTCKDGTRIQKRVINQDDLP